MSQSTPDITDNTTLGHVLMVCGDQSGIGKTSACIGLLNALCEKFSASEIAYIKPCTQCESVQLLWKFCNNMGITCNGIGPIVYRPGFTQECIDNQHGSSNDRLNLIEEEIIKLRHKHKFVLIDGVGYPGVGSCVGCSNRDVAKRIGCPVLMISRPGVGNMIDSCVMNIEYMAYRDVITIGTIVNKIPTSTKKISYHSGDKIKEYVTKFFTNYTYTTRNLPQSLIRTKTGHTGQLINQTEKKDMGKKDENGDYLHQIQIYGFVPSYTLDDDSSCATSCAVSCALKPNVDITEFDLELTDLDWKELSLLLKNTHKSVNYTNLFQDVDNFFQPKEIIEQ